jgi:hypothetical protein
MLKKRFTAPTAVLVGEIALERLGLLDMEARAAVLAAS